MSLSEEKSFLSHTSCEAACTPDIRIFCVFVKVPAFGYRLWTLGIFFTSIPVQLLAHTV